MTAATEVIGPVVRMCGNPQCGGRGACDRIGAAPFIGFTAWLEPGLMADDVLAAYFAQELAFSVASDSSGTEYLVPDGMEFTVHKGSAAVPAGERPEGALEAFAVLYSGDAATRDEALEGAPAYLTGDEPIARLARMRDAGRLRGLDAFPGRYVFASGYCHVALPSDP